MASGAALIWDLIARDAASPTFNRVAASADRAAVATDRAAVSTDKAAGSMLGFSKKVMAGFAGFAVADILGHAVTSAISFQKQMTLIQTQAGASAKEVKGFNGALLKMSGQVAAAPNDLSTSLYHVYSALKKVGATGPQMLNTVKIAAEGAKVGNTDLEDTTNSLTATLASGIVKFNQAGKAMGYLNAIVGAGDMKFSDLNQALGTGVLVTMRTLGVSLKDTGAALAVFGDNNIRGADAATKLRMSVQDLVKPAAHADDVLSQIGLSSEKLRESMSEHGLAGTLELLKRKMTEAGVTGNKVGGFLMDAFTKKAGAGLAVLLTRLKQFQAAGADETKQANGFGAAWAATTHTAAFQLQRLGAEFEAAGIAVGEKLLPAVTAVGKWLADTLPRAARDLGSALHPFIVGLTDVAHFVAANKTLVETFGVAVVGMWAGFKLYSIAVNAFKAVSLQLNLMKYRLLAVGDSAAASAAKVATFGDMAKASLGAAGFGLAAGMMTRSASTATKAVAALGAAGAGAMMGFSAGGPPGAVIGGLVGGLTSLASSFMNNTHAMTSAQKEAAFYASTVAGLTDAIAKDNGVLATNTKNYVANALQKSGAADAAQKLGVNLHTLELAAMGNAGAQQEVNAQYDEWFKNIYPSYMNSVEDNFNHQGKLTEAQKKTSASLDVQLGAWAKVRHAVNDESGAVGKATAKYQQHVALVDKNGAAQAQLTTVVNLSTASTNRNTASLGEQLAAMTKVQNKALAMVQGEDGYRLALDQMSQSLAKNSDSLSKNSQGGLTNRTAIESLISQAMTAAKTMNGPYQLALANNIDALIKHATELGINRKALVDLLGEMHLIPKDMRTQFQLDGVKSALSDLAKMGKLIGDVQGYHVATVVVQNSAGGQWAHGNTSGVVHKATGGPIVGPGTATSDSIPAMLSNGEYVVNAASTAKWFPLLDAINNGVAKFSTGGVAGQVAGILKGNGYNARAIAGILGNMDEESGLDPYRRQGSPAGSRSALIPDGNTGWGLVQWTSRGYQDHLLHRFGRYPTAAQQTQYLVSLIGGLRGALNNAPDAASAADIFMNGFEHPGDPNAGARESAARKWFGALYHGRVDDGGGSGSGGGSGVPSKVSKARHAAYYHSHAGAQNAANGLRSGLQSWVGSFGSQSSERHAFRGLLPDVRKLGGDDKFIAHLERQNDRLDRAIWRRNKATKALDKARAKWHALKQARAQLQGSIGSSVRGLFDITSAGANPNTGAVSAGAMLAQEKQAENTISLWSNGILKLHRMGLSGQMLIQLAQAGPSSWPQVNALLHASPKVFREILAGERQIDAMSHKLAKRVGGIRYGGEIRHEHRQVREDERRLRIDERDVAKLAKKIGDEIGEKFGHEFSQLHIEVKIDKKAQARIVRDGEKQLKRDGHHVK